MKRKQKDLLFDTLVTVVAIILGIIIIFPLIYCFLSSFKTPSEFLNPKLFPSSLLYLDNFKNALERGNLLRYTLNSFVIAFEKKVLHPLICASIDTTGSPSNKEGRTKASNAL